MSSKPVETPAAPNLDVRTNRRKQQPPAITGSGKAVAKAAKRPAAAIAEPEPRMTKQERVLTLLSRKDGASIEEIMATTSWQQHSVRGFFAGTVKKKLGFDLTSSMKEGEGRRYRIETGSGN